MNKIEINAETSVKAWEMTKGQIGLVTDSTGFNGTPVIRAHKQLVSLENGDTWTLEEYNNIPSFRVKILPQGTRVTIEVK